MTNGITIALARHGINPEVNKFLTNLEYTIMIKQDTNVVKVPKIISNGPTVEAKLASKQPNVKPIV